MDVLLDNVQDGWQDTPSTVEKFYTNVNRVAAHKQRQLDKEAEKKVLIFFFRHISL